MKDLEANDSPTLIRQSAEAALTFESVVSKGKMQWTKAGWNVEKRLINDPRRSYAVLVMV